jgi:putative FmdB family regulatory protein
MSLKDSRKLSYRPNITMYHEHTGPIAGKNIFGREDSMPVYRFFCKKHGSFEKITIKAEWDNIRCPKCGTKPQLDKEMQFRAKKPV